MTQAPEGFRTGPIVYPSPLHALTGWFRDHGYALHATCATPEDWLQRRRLFEAVMAAVPPCDDPLLSAEASRQASEAFRELGSRLLGVAYRLEAWPQAERLEALGQAPDGAGGPSMPSSMHLAGVAAWERAVAQGWDPAAPIDSGRHRESRWRRWIGDRLPAHNETNDPLTAHAVAWARTHDPEGLKDWQCVGADQAARSAGSPEAVEAAAVLLEPLLPDVLHTGGRREPLWFKLLVSHPNLWASRLEPFSPHIAAHIQPCPDEPLWTQLGSSVADRVWMAVPEPLRQQTLALCLQHGTPPPSGCLSTRGPLDKDSPYTRWLTRVLPPSWL